MKTKLYNQEAKAIGEIELSDKVFGAKWNPILVHQIVVALDANRRKPIAHAKGRGEVRGGGKKPWKQKGTGRARHGSIRSPLWKGGGVTFGPTKERNFSLKINKKAKQQALFSVLSKKLSDQQIKFIDEIKIKDVKTKEMAKILGNFFETKKNSGLVILAKSNPELIRSTRNLNFAQICSANNMNIKDLLLYKNILIFKDVINSLNK
jgi:large subunit ribosomal protein L4